MTEQEIAGYVERVRQALADLPPTVRDELLEDLPEHLAEVAAEDAGAFAERLGPPEAYAAELRAAAGLTAPDPTPDLDKRIATAVRRLRGQSRVLDGRVGPLIGYATASEFFRLLQPAWWVVRGYLVAMFVTVLLTGEAFGLLPRLGGSSLAAVLLLAGCVVGSIWLGRRTRRASGWRRRLVNLGTVALVLFGVYGFFDADQRGLSTNYYQPSYNENPYSSVQDVYVYDRQGRLIEGARLFDQEGRPIRLGYPWCPEAEQLAGGSTQDLTLAPYPFCPQGAPFQFSGPVPSPAPTGDPSALPTADPSAAPTGTAAPTTTAAVPTGRPAPTGTPGR